MSQISLELQHEVSQFLYREKQNCWTTGNSVSG